MSIASDSDYEALIHSAGALIRPRGVLRVGGSEAAEFLQGQLTNDIEALEPGGGCYALLLTHKGRIRADMRVLRLADGFLIDCEPIATPILERMIATYSLGRQVTHANETDALELTSLIGPDSARAVDVELGPTEHDNATDADRLVVRTDVGLDVIAPRGSGLEPDLTEVSEASAECVRIERGRPRLGIDIGGETIPQEAALNERAVSFTKGCYVGQETVARLHYKGRPNRHLRGLALAEAADPGVEVYSGDKPVGKLGSTCVSPAHGPIALGLIRRELGVGDAVQVGEGRAPAELVELPFR